MDDHDVELPVIPLPGYEARQRARVMVALPVIVASVVALLSITAPTPMGGMESDPDPLGALVPGIGIGMFLVGLAWMIRIYRVACDVEPDHGNWRYRSR